MASNQIELTREEKAQAIKALSGALKAWGPKGEHWIQGQWHDDGDGAQGAVCLLGGLDLGLNGHITEYVPEFISNLVGQQLPQQYRGTGDGDVIGFNDADETGFPQVKRVVCRTLKKVMNTRAKAKKRVKNA